jgi:hypothetical protein
MKRSLATMTTKRTMKKKSSFKLPADEIERIKKMVPTVAELRIIDLMRDYRVVRKRYHGTNIPPVELVNLRFLPRSEIKRLSGHNDDETVGLCLCGKFRGAQEPFCIFVADDLSACETRITLVHETAHMKVNLKFGREMGHGEQWKKEMRRLAAAGAFDNWW